LALEFPERKSNMPGRLPDKVAVITGGGSGLGRASAFLFSEEGAKLVVVDIVKERAEATAADVRARGGEAIAATADVTVEEEVKSAIARATEEYGGLDILFNNVGIDLEYGLVPFEESDTAAWRRVLDVNLVGHMLGSKHAIDAMRERGGGSIIMTSSVAGIVAMRHFSAYCASKAAVNALVRSLALELGQYNIRVNAIAPMDGMSLNFWLPPDAKVMDQSWAELGAGENWDPMRSALPLKAPRPPGFRDNAYAALFLASDESSYMSGVCIPTGTGGMQGVSAVQASGTAARARATGLAVGAIFPDATQVTRGS
jgi:NAD(P)-dependent dehydrogenase (short-subunit alcohol dehydrogenase family)